MADLIIDTAAVIGAAENLEKINQEINEGFTAVLDAIRRLEDCWSGEAAVHSVTAFEQLRENFVEQRSAVLNGYAAFLRGQVAQGYEAVEEANEAAAGNLEEAFL